jgi:short-subunit dehydrogenase
MQQDKTVLITGATSGIGFELALLFARNKFNMVIVSRYLEQLMQVSQQLRDEGSGKVTVIAKDLSLPGAAEEVYKETKRKGIHVNILVNDAGVGEYGLFAENELQKEISLIQLNVISLVTLTKLYLKDMIATKGGRILQLASVAAYQPTPRLAVYAATKSFVLSFSDALGIELRDEPVTVTALVPDATDTDFFRKAGMEHSKAAVRDPEDPAIVARIGYEALMAGEPHAFAPGVRKSIMMSSVLPNRTIAGMAEKQVQEETGKKKKRPHH